MKRFACLAGAAALALFAFPRTASAGNTLDLVGVTYPEGKKISVPFVKTAIAPKNAVLTGTVRMQKGQAEITLEWEKMEPAVLFAGAEDNDGSDQEVAAGGLGVKRPPQRRRDEVLGSAVDLAEFVDVEGGGGPVQ